MCRRSRRSGSRKGCAEPWMPRPDGGAVEVGVAVVERAARSLGCRDAATGSEQAADNALSKGLRGALDAATGHELLRLERGRRDAMRALYGRKGCAGP